MNKWIGSLVGLIVVKSVFASEGHVELLHEHYRSHYEQEQLEALCGYQGSQKSIEWACYFKTVEPIEIDVLEHQCEHWGDRVHSLRQIPESKFLERLPQICKTTFEGRRQILDYKSKGP